MSFKKFCAFTAAVLILCVGLTVFASADAHDPRVVDEAGLLTAQERVELESKLDKYSEELQFDLVVLIVNDIYEYDYSSYAAFADDYYDYHNYGYGEDHTGAMLLYEVDANYRYLSTFGEGIDALTVDDIMDSVIGYFNNKQYARAFNAFADTARSTVLDFRSFHWGTKIAVGLIIGLIVALIVTGSMKKKLTSVRMATEANDYVIPGTLNITESRDTFLYSHVTRTERQSSSSSSSGSHTSSSGRSHGGGGF